MARTKKRTNDRYTLAYKEQAVRLSLHPNVMAKDIAEGLGIHPIMLYRWRMEHNRGSLQENLHMKEPENKSPKRRKGQPDPHEATQKELVAARKKIKDLEKSLASRSEEIDILKKAQRFFEKNKT